MAARPSILRCKLEVEKKLKPGSKVIEKPRCQIKRDNVGHIAQVVLYLLYGLVTHIDLVGCSSDDTFEKHVSKLF